MQTRSASYTIPLYNLQEEVIGEFRISSTPEVTGCTLEEAEAPAASGQ